MNAKPEYAIVVSYSKMQHPKRCYYVVDDDGIIQRWNKAGDFLFGTKADAREFIREKGGVERKEDKAEKP